MKRERDFWTKHWLEHFILLCLVFLIGLTLLFLQKVSRPGFLWRFGQGDCAA